MSLYNPPYNFDVPDILGVVAHLATNPTNYICPFCGSTKGLSGHEGTCQVLMYQVYMTSIGYPPAVGSVLTM